ncbi:hypothetical protein M407DRAFT_198489 [Tulasnella calospora MUT 4182]|uniref:Uncharacterized protein n=1 Tax=Tulasnella calospora MUT 4182 TaxID=1051891 RepID=A0A0C3MHU5_9AGAM|nr:hypothetical protein M407DRAFT_198489 [Tulasnella calospora MUT 4182]
MIHHTTTLPPETWLLVIETLFHSLLPSVPVISASSSENRIARSPLAIRNLCLVSRFFLQLADPFRFQEIHMARYLERSARLRRVHRDAAVDPKSDPRVKGPSHSPM